jgi:hypothetical protein
VHAQIAGSLNNLGLVYRDQHKLAEAEAVHRQATTMLLQLLGTNHLATASSLDVLARVLCDESKWTEAEADARISFGVWQSQRPDDWRAFSAQSVLGASLLGQKKYAQAATNLVAGCEGMSRHLDKIPAGHRSRLLESGRQLIVLYRAWENPDKPDRVTYWTARTAEFDKIEPK